MRNWVAALILTLAVSVPAVAEEAEKQTFFDLYSMTIPAGWTAETSVEEYSVSITSEDGNAMIYVLPPDPDTNASLDEYAEWFLDRYADGIGAGSWGIITEDSENDFNGYESFMLMVGFPEENSKLIAIINIFDVAGFQVLQFGFTGVDKVEEYMKTIGTILDSYSIDEEAMKKVEFSLKKKGDYIANKLNKAE